MYEDSHDPRQDVALAVTPPGRSLSLTGEGQVTAGDPVHRALAHYEDLPQRHGDVLAHLVLREPGGVCLPTERVVEVGQLDGVGRDDGPPVASQGAGLVHQVPQTVTVDDDWNIEIHDLLQHQRDPAQHGLVPAQAGPDDDTVEARQPGVHLLHAVLLVQHRVDHQRGAEAPDDGGGGLLAEHVDTVSTRAEGRHSAAKTE